MLSYEEILSRVQAEFHGLQDERQVPALLRNQDARARRAGAQAPEGESGERCRSSSMTGSRIAGDRDAPIPVSTHIPFPVTRTDL